MSCHSNRIKTYSVKKAPSAIRLSGTGNDPLWETAGVLTDFTYPWETETAPPTTFRALWTDTHLYFLFHAVDPEIITPQRGRGERDAVDSDRVEIFFKADDNMDPYYSLEMDALGRVLDTEGRFPRKIDFDWNWPEGHLVVRASIDETGYRVEGSITFESLRLLGMYQDDGLLKAGLFRGDYQTSKTDGRIETKWISWILPDSPKPDFHIPSAFGILKLAGLRNRP